MTALLCRNRVEDFDRWKSVFDAQLPAAEHAGLTLQRLWCENQEPRNVFFLFAVQSEERARAFLDDPDSARAGQIAGVLEGEYHFLHDPELDR